MTDIVERLRIEANSCRDVCNALETANCMREAADEIERLREQMESGNFLTENDKLILAIERQALEIKERDDEIKKLLAALVQIVEYDRCHYSHDGNARIVRIAQAALGESEA